MGDRRISVPASLSLFVAATMGLHACSFPYVGGALPLDPSRLTSEADWVTVDASPVRQRDATDCGPATLAMVARHWGVDWTLDAAIADLPPPREHGVRLGDLRAAARERGLDAYAIRADRDILEHELREGRPVVIGLLLRHRMHRVRSHYELVVALNDRTGELVTIDPAAGYRVRSFSDLDEEWKPAGRPALVVLGPRTPEGSASVARK